MHRVAYLKNRILDQTVGSVSFELNYGKPPDMNIFQMFGYDAYMRLPDNLRKNL